MILERKKSRRGTNFRNWRLQIFLATTFMKKYSLFWLCEIWTQQQQKHHLQFAAGAHKFQSSKFVVARRLLSLLCSAQCNCNSESSVESLSFDKIVLGTMFHISESSISSINFTTTQTFVALNIYARKNVISIFRICKFV